MRIIRKIPLLILLNINFVRSKYFVFSEYRTIETVDLANMPVIPRVYFFF